MIVGERPPSTDMNFGWWYAGFGGNGTGAFDATLGMSDNVQGIAELESQCQAGPDRFRIGRLREQCDCRHYWSLHPGGAHFLFADSSVQFLSYSTSQVALNAFATIADGEVFAGE